VIDRNDVPCGKCNACCRNERVILSQEHSDRADDYVTVPTRQGIDGKPALMLQHRPNGDCVYLGVVSGRCTIHDDAPWACRQFDCRKWLAGFPEAMQDLLTVDNIDGEVVKAARERIGE
jgi:Fe-S-cluster containining protein